MAKVFEVILSKADAKRLLAERAEVDRQRAVIDEYLARLVPPRLKVRKSRATPAVDIASRILKEIYPSELIPGTIPVKALRGRILERLRLDEKPPSPDSVSLARARHNQAMNSR